MFENEGRILKPSHEEELRQEFLMSARRSGIVSNPGFLCQYPHSCPSKYLLQQEDRGIGGGDLFAHIWTSKHYELRGCKYSMVAYATCLLKKLLLFIVPAFPSWSLTLSAKNELGPPPEALNFCAAEI